MEIIFILLTGAIMGALFVGCFALGYYFGTKKPEEGIVATEQNQKYIEQMLKWRNYSGKESE